VRLVHSTSAQGTVVASLARTLLAGASRAGAHPAELLRRAHVDEQTLAQPDARIPYTALTQLWCDAAEQSRDPAFGIHLAQSSIEDGSFGEVGLLARSRPTIGDCLQPVAALATMINETTHTTLERRHDGMIIADGHCDRRVHWPRQMAESLMASYLVLGQKWTGEKWRPAEVHFQHERPSNVSELHAFFGCPLHFGQTENRIIVSSRVLALPLLTASPEFADRLEALAERVLEKRIGPRRFVHAVRNAIHSALLLGIPDVDSVARHLKMSPRTLQRRLKDEGSAYSDLLDDVRGEIALSLMQSELSLTEISAALQFAEPRAFRRAFQRWTGRSPNDFRRTVLGVSARGGRGAIP
jgi:AraC-like DNA-binding protein